MSAIRVLAATDVDEEDGVMQYCQVDSCNRKIPDNYVICNFHWRQVPKPVKDEFNRLIDEYHEEADRAKKLEIGNHWQRLLDDIIRNLNEEG